jgi:SAM-dependent methyltransferase
MRGSAVTKGLRDLTAAEGRNAFGADAANYDSARPPYPAWVYDTLGERCGLGPGCRMFEIGPGPGLATARMLARGPSLLTAIEPDARLAAFLAEKCADPALRVVNAAFEDAVLEDGAFDLGTSATAFHWMDQRPALAKVARALRPGGRWAAWWNVFGDPDREDPFHEATQHVLAHMPGSPSHTVGQAHPFALDETARIADIAAVGVFDDIAVDIRKWTLVLDTAQTRALYATYSQFSVLDAAERERILDSLAGIAEREFAGRVERNMCTALYTARRR